MSAFSETCARWAAISSLLFTPLAAALPSSSPGSLDPTYGADGVLAFSIRDGLELIYGIVPGRDGKWLVTGSAQGANEHVGVRYLLRLDSNGGIDTGFGAQGLLYPGGDARVLAVQASGSILIAGTHGDGSGVENATLRRLLPDGAPDPDFGTTGGATILQSATADWPSQSFAALEVDAQGRIVGGTSLRANVPGAQRGEVWRFTADGVPDATFGSQGRAALDDVAPYLQLQQLQVQPDGKVVIAAWCQADVNARARACVVRLNNDGSRDTAFGPDGVRDIAPPAGTSYHLYELRIAGDGKIYAAGANFSMRPATAFIIRLNADGAMDAGYGNGGIAALTFPGNYAYVYALHPLADGRQIVVGYRDSPEGRTVGYVARLTPGGLPDPSFGTGGFGARASAADNIFRDAAVLADGSILAVGWRYNVPDTTTDVDTLLVRYVGVETLGDVIEFHNTLLDHYFITADPNEAAAIDGGAAGPGWVRTGKSFKSGGPNRVCRFYGAVDIDPATGLRRGPNSHFYTIEAAECAAVRLDPGWHFESYDFSGWLRNVDGSCPTGTVAVKRAYNNRFAQNDSNHRYTIGQATYDQMVAAGWAPEGTVFCSIQ